MTYRGHECGDETGLGEEIRGHTETKGKPKELMWLPVSICKVFNSPKNFPETPQFPLHQLSPQPPSILRYTLRVAHFHLWSFPCTLNLFIKHCQGSQPWTWRMGQGKKRPGKGTDLYSRSHRRCTSSKAGIEEEPPTFQKKIKQGTGRGENSTACWILDNMGHGPTHAHSCQHM